MHIKKKEKKNTPQDICIKLINIEKIPSSILSRWGYSLLWNGWTTIPNGLLLHQKDLDLSNSEMMLLIHMISFMHHPDSPISPSISTLAKRINQHERTVQRTIDKLLNKKIIERKIRSKSPLDKGMTNLYNLDPLIEKLILLHKAEKTKKEGYMNSKNHSSAAVTAIMSLRSSTSTATVIEALGQAGGEAAVTAIMSLRSHSSSATVIKALGQAGGEAAVTAIMSLRSSTSTATVIEALGQAGGEAAVTAIMSLRSHSSSATVIKALGQAGGEAAVTAIMSLRSSTSTATVIEALGQAGGEAAVTAIMSLRSHSSSATVIKALGQAGRYRK